SSGFPQFPFISNNLTFTFNASGNGLKLVSASQITSVEFLFGTSGAGTITARATPEPSSLALAGIGVVGLAGYWRRKKRRVATSVLQA
ncbi:MAG TPA: PEP-CTERM sorting domain-containing protein, partial [Planctomycetaceae bacterium]|nr:PEP-CTERM sorting domain-containing protein [Planctomycetaceae bacterium]